MRVKVYPLQVAEVDDYRWARYVGPEDTAELIEQALMGLPEKFELQSVVSYPAVLGDGPNDEAEHTEPVLFAIGYVAGLSSVFEDL